MSIRELSEVELEQVSGGYVFRPSDDPRKWEIISDFDGSVMDTITGGRDDAEARARELGQSTDEIGWNKLDFLRRMPHGIIFGD